jgi:hypothetical protein
MCGGIDFMLSEKGGYYAVIGANELALSGSLTPIYFPNNTHEHVLYLSAILSKKT